MAIESRIRELDTRHRKLDDAILEETSRPAADTFRVAELKRQKLKLKEEILGLKARLN